MQLHGCSITRARPLDETPEEFRRLIQEACSGGLSTKKFQQGASTRTQLSVEATKARFNKFSQLLWQKLSQY